MRTKVLFASAAAAMLLACGSSFAAPSVGGDQPRAQRSDAIQLAQRGGGGGMGGGGARFGGGGMGGGRAVIGGGGGARFVGGGAPRFVGAPGVRAVGVGGRPRMWAGAPYWRRGAWRAGYGWGYPYYGWGWGLGLGYGLGYGWGYPYYGDYYYAEPAYYGGGGVADCTRFRTYNPATGKYRGRDGKLHRCT